MRYLAVLLVLLSLSTVDTASAQPNRAREGVRSGQMRSLDQILSDIRRGRPGNLSDVQGPFDGPAGEPHYRLKWLTPDGRVEWLDTDARTGRVLGVEGGGPNLAPNGPRGRGFQNLPPRDSGPARGRGGEAPRFPGRNPGRAGPRPGRFLFGR